MSRPVRLTARDPAISCLVQAPAGSGKTELLTQRILALLAVVDEPEEILALTFTRKAAAEMRRRVMDALAAPRPEVEHGEEPSHKLETWALAQKALARSRELGWQLELNPSRLRIMTLDSLCHALARQLPLLSGMGEMPTPLDEPGIAYQEAAEAALEECLRSDPESTARVLLHLDHDSREAINLIAAMLGKREQWLGELAMHGRDMPGLRSNLEANLSCLIEASLARLDALMPEEARQRLPALMRFAAAMAEAPAWPALEHWPAAAIECLEQWKGMAAFLLTSKGEIRRRVDKGLGFPAGKEHAPQKQAMLELLERLKQVDGLAEALQEVSALPQQARIAEHQWQVLCSLFVLLLAANQRLVERFAARGEADFTEIALRALDALGAYDASPGEVLLKLDYRIHHILVDEFQDTSLIQMRLLQCLTSGWQEGDGVHRSLFLVGDPMQSIYRFRKAEVGLFMQAAANQAGLPPVEALQLERNFRSAPALVDWVNRAFSSIFPEQSDATGGAVAHTPARAALDHDGEVNLNLTHGDDPTLEAAAITALIGEELRRDERLRIGVLARSRGHLQALMPALEEAGIAFRAVQIQPLSHRPEVRLLRALLRALMHPLDRIAWAALLKAPCCGLDHRDLHALLHSDAGSKEQLPVWRLMHDETLLEQLSASGRQRLLFLRQALRPGVELFSRLPLRPLLQAVWQRLRMPALLDATARENVATVLDLIESLDHGGLVDLQHLDRRLDGLYAAADTSEAAARVELMTMHGAKGLQWDVVILPGLGKTGRNGEQPLIAFSEVPVHGDALPLMAPRAPKRDQDALYTLVQGLEKKKDAHELQRLLYVACTRAQTRLHLFGHVSERSGKAASGSLLELILNADANAFGARISLLEPEAFKAERPGPGLPTRMCQVPEAMPDPGRSSDEIEFSWAGPEAAPVGIAVHAALQYIAGHDGAIDDADINRLIRRRLLHEGLCGELLESAAARAMQAIRAAMQSPIGRWVLDRHEDAHCEWPLSQRQVGLVSNRVIDRSFVDNGVRWIIDYKTASHQGGNVDAFLASELERYRPQLEAYVAVLRQLEPDRNIRAGLYFPLLDAMIELDGRVRRP